MFFMPLDRLSDAAGLLGEHHAGMPWLHWHETLMGETLML